jgi:hypothetical protein
MKTSDATRTLKNLYSATRKIKDVVADKATFLAIDGQGAPGGEAFQQAITSLYATAYTVKFALKAQEGPDFKVGKLECLYLSDPCTTSRDQWQWRLLLRVADDVTAKDLTAAKKAIREKKDLDASNVKRITWKEGRALQVLHVGPYDQVGARFDQLQAHAAELGLTVKGSPHEIYISDPRLVTPEKLKTIVRLPVK